MRNLRLVLGTCALALATPALAQEQGAEVGTAVVAAENVKMAFGGASTSLGVNDRVRFGADLITGPLSANVDEFDDGSRLTIGEDAVVKIDRFVYREQGAGELAISHTKGALRFVTGRMNSESYTIRTPVSILGVRGTRFVIGHSDSAGTTVIVEEGEVEFSNLAGASVTVPAGFASTIDSADADPSEPAAPGPAQAAVTTSVNIAAAVAAPAALSLPAVSQSIQGQAAAAAAAATSADAMSGSSDFGGSGSY